MSSKNLIQSGILELYALGLCSEEETLRVEEALRTDEQVRKEYDEVCEALEHLAAERDITPPSFLKDKLMEAIDGLEQKKVELPHEVEVKATQTPTKETSSPVKKEVPVVQLNSNKWKWLAAASVVLFMASAGLNYRFYQRMTFAEEEANLLRNNNMLLSDEYGIIKSNFDIMQQQYAFFENKNLKPITLGGTEAFPESEALVFWDQGKGEVYLIANELKALSEDEQYQLWALDNGVPKDAGLLPSDFKDGGAYKLKNISSSQAFAITIEKKGGSASPTLDKMIVFGNI